MKTLNKILVFGKWLEIHAITEGRSGNWDTYVTVEDGKLINIHEDNVSGTEHTETFPGPLEYTTSKKMYITKIYS